LFFKITCNVFYFCVAVFVGVLPLNRRGDALELLSEDEWKGFFDYFQLVTETVREFFQNTYDLHVASIDSDKLQCFVHSVDALDKFWKDLENESARIKFEKALDFREADPLIRLELSAFDYFKAKDFFASLDSTQSQQM